jgi:hypothetical protein
MHTRAAPGKTGRETRDSAKGERPGWAKVTLEAGLPAPAAAGLACLWEPARARHRRLRLENWLSVPGCR